MWILISLHLPLISDPPLDLWPDFWPTTLTLKPDLRSLPTTLICVPDLQPWTDLWPDLLQLMEGFWPATLTWLPTWPVTTYRRPIICVDLTSNLTSDITSDLTYDLTSDLRPWPATLTYYPELQPWPANLTCLISVMSGTGNSSKDTHSRNSKVLITIKSRHETLASL